MGNIFRGSYLDVHEAARTGHIDEVRRWVDAGKPVDALDNTQKTPLHYAAQWGQEETLDFLIECGANVNAADFIEDTPLHFACYWGHAACARILLIAGANVSAKDCYGNTPSQIFDDHIPEAVLDEIRDMVREIIKSLRAGGLSTHNRQLDDSAIEGPTTSQTCIPTINIAPVLGSSRTHSFADSSNVAAPALTSSPVATNADGALSPSVASDLALRVLSHAAPPRGRFRGEPYAPYLPPQSHDVEAQDTEGTDFGSTMRGPGFEDAQECPQNSNARDSGPVGVTDAAKVVPLGAPVGSEGGSDERSAALGPVRVALPWDEELGQDMGHTGDERKLKVGTEERARTHTGPLRPLSAPPLRQGAPGRVLANTSPALTPTLLSARANSIAGGEGYPRGPGLNGASLAGTLVAYATGPNGKLDVFGAARDGQVSVLKQALAEGEKVDVVDDSGMTPLMWAARAGRLSTAKYLVSQRARLLASHDPTGFSPLHFAAYYCRSAVVKELVVAGASTTVTDNYGTVPGGRFRPLSYFSYGAFRQRQLIKRFLAGDLEENLGDDGKTMFPMHAPLEAYDEDHKPQYVRLGSMEHLPGPQERQRLASRARQAGRRLSGASLASLSSVAGGIERASQRMAKESSQRARSSARVVAQTVEYEGKKKVSNDSTKTHVRGAHNYRTGAKQLLAKTSMPKEGSERAPGAGSGVHYYLRRTSLPGCDSLPISLRQPEKRSSDGSGDNDSEDRSAAGREGDTGNGSDGNGSDRAIAAVMTSTVDATPVTAAAGARDSGLIGSADGSNNKGEHADAHFGAAGIAHEGVSSSATPSDDVVTGTGMGRDEFENDELREMGQGGRGLWWANKTGSGRHSKIRAEVEKSTSRVLSAYELGEARPADGGTGANVSQASRSTEALVKRSDGTVVQPTTQLQVHQEGSDIDVDGPPMTAGNANEIFVAHRDVPADRSGGPPHQAEGHATTTADNDVDNRRERTEMTELVLAPATGKPPAAETFSQESPVSPSSPATSVTSVVSSGGPEDEDTRRRRERIGDRKRRHRHQSHHKNRDRTVNRQNRHRGEHAVSAGEERDEHELAPLPVPKRALPPIVLGGAGRGRGGGAIDVGSPGNCRVDEEASFAFQHPVSSSRGISDGPLASIIQDSKAQASSGLLEDLGMRTVELDGGIA